MSELGNLTLGGPKARAELGSDPNSDWNVRHGQSRITDLAKPQVQGSDPDSAGNSRALFSPLWNRIQASGMDVLAVMGMTKNTGKTVALNHVLAQAAKAQVAVGVTSIGRDGEDRDVVFFIPKPPIYVWSGTLVVTARATLARAKARIKLIDSTGIDSPMGEILVVKVLDAGEMEVAGASRSSDQRKVIARLKQCGASLVILDGALGRSHHASPAIANGVILATGAAMGGGIADVIRKTRDRLAILGIAQADDTVRTLCEQVFAAGGVGLWDSQGNQLFMANISTINSAVALMEYAQSDIKIIALSGAVGRSLWCALLALASSKPGLTVVVNDGTRLFVQASDLQVFTQLGAQLLAYRGMHMTGITLNPFSPMGGSFDAQEFLTAARLAFPLHGVSDVMLEDQPVADFHDFQATPPMLNADGHMTVIADAIRNPVDSEFMDAGSSPA